MKTSIVILALCVLATGCANSPRPEASTADSQAAVAKITFDLSRLDDQGLAGPADGKVAVSYEFCIPDTDRHRREVRSIDPSVKFHPDSKGRIGCTEDQCLCIGSTHQPNFRQILNQLAGLPYIRRIDQCFFE